ncbi:flagellar hook-length control protein FliK [Spirochaeta africana]|uniref:Flagellar hook-length control protein n=1 Tax=Spirochaeta africana (strain ATCC 700263 / DSM 8902 / Z-7692) TaxID=889378 RepID=H9UKV4_SPIAZ|nr:flagellar hook-length control protein FliK [Spirochaeta africana]AFG38147.1 flagellar hook-length control protein [Spirochaeta africana DSM 8902]
MTLDFLQVNPERSTVLEQAGSFGVLPVSTGPSFYELLTRPGDSVRENPPDPSAYPPPDTTNQASEDDPLEDADNPDRDRIDHRAVAELLQHLPPQTQPDSGERGLSLDAARLADRVADAARALAESEQVSDESGELRAAEHEGDRLSIEEIEQIRSDAGLSDAGAADRIASLLDTQKSSRVHPDESTGTSVKDSRSAGASSEVSRLSASAEEAEAAVARRIQRAAAAHMAAEAGQEDARAAAEPPARTALQQLKVPGEESDTRESGVVRQAAGRDAAEGSRRTLVQIVDLRRDDRPTRIEQFRAELRQEAGGRSAGLRGEAAGRGGSSFAGQDTNSGGSGGQPGQDFGSRNGFAREIMDRFFRGDSGTSRQGDAGEPAFAAMMQRTQSVQPMPQQLSADAARMLSGKFQEHLSSDIVRQAKFVLRDGDAGEIRLRLRPESLGSVQIMLDVEDSVIAARILVENSSVRQVFEQQAAELVRAFEEAGLALGSMEVSVGNEDNPGTPGESAEPRQLHADRQDSRHVEALGDSVRDIAMLGNGDRLINLMA